jgi:acyl-CoA thioesterase YciA
MRELMADAETKDAESETKAMPEGPPAIRTVTMPFQTNAAGDIFGGWLLYHMDMAAGSVAYRCARGRCATVAIDRMTFESPVKVGDEVTIWAELVHVGKTSMKFKVSAWRRARDTERSTRVTEALFTFVALDSEGQPRPVRAADLAATSEYSPNVCPGKL